jgi:predicted permease
MPREPMSVRVYRACLSLFPRSFRQRFGPELLATFEAQYGELPPSAGARFFFLVRALADALSCAVSERFATEVGGASVSGALDTAAAALRTVRRSPRFAAAVVLTLALGIGANLAIFAVADRLLLSPPAHVLDAARVVQIHFQRISPFTGVEETSASLAYRDLQDLESVEAFESVAGFSNLVRTMGSGEEAERVHVQMAGAALFGLLGVRPALGRFFAPEEDRIEGAEMTAVLSHGFWTRRFAADPKVLGRTLHIGRGRYTVVGVAPRSFTGPSVEPVDVWLPMLTAQAAEAGTEGWPTSRRWYWLGAVARLAPDATLDAAQAQATAAHRAGRSEEVQAGRYDEAARAVFGSLIPGRGPNAGMETRVAAWLVGVSVLVLLIACANVANLLFLRAVRRRREMALRSALGGSRGRLAGFLLAEAVLLASLAGAGALLAGRFGGALIYRTLLPDLDPGSTVLGPRMILFAAAAVAVAALLAGVLPALQASRPDLASDLKEGGRSTTATGRTRAVLLTVQVSLSVALLAGAGLFLRSLSAAHALDLGFETDRLVVGWLETESGAFTDESALAVQTAMDRLRGHPAVENVAAVSLAPFNGLLGLTLMRAPGDTVEVSRGPIFYEASTDYFQTMGMRVTRGRGFVAADAVEGAPLVTVLTEDLARRAFGAEDPLGRCVYVEQRSDETPPCTRVVGLLRDHRSYALEETETSVFYLPAGQSAGRAPPQTLVVRARSSSRDLVPLVRGALLDATPSARFANVSLFSNSVAERTRPWRLGAVLFTLFGALALTVATLGLYALVAFDVAQRRRELALRAALGARRERVAARVVAGALLRTAAGTALGLLLAFALARAGEGMLLGVEPGDATVLAGTTLLLLVVSALAALPPALAAAGVSASEVLRAE